MKAFVIVLLAQAAISREDDMHVIRVKDAESTKWTHACVDATITKKIRERDGDIHVRLEADGSYLIGEAIPQIPLVVPKKGTRVRACGITRIDKFHATKEYPGGWPELHPLLTIKEIK